jgi:hypothetical protein
MKLPPESRDEGRIGEPELDATRRARCYNGDGATRTVGLLYLTGFLSIALGAGVSARSWSVGEDARMPRLFFPIFLFFF